MLDLIELDSSHYGLIIGKKGSSIRTLNEMPGIQKVKLDRTNTEKHTLKVTGKDLNACQNVIEEVKKRIGAVKRIVQNDDVSLNNVKLKPYNDNENEIVVTTELNLNQSPQLYLVSEFSLDEFQPTDRYKSVTGPGNASAFLESTNTEGIKTAFRAGLESNQNSGAGRLSFTVSPGKIVFSRTTSENSENSEPPTLRRDVLTSRHCGSYMRRLNLEPFFTKQLTLPHFDLISRRLESLGFHLLTSYDEGFPVVYLDVPPRDPKTVQFTATLALDENLKVFKTSANDPRMSEEKKEAVENILKANTIGELFADRTNVKIEFRKKSIPIAATTNAHQGVENALEILKDAKVKTLNGDPPTTPVIAVEVIKGADSMAANGPPLPKVVKLRTKPPQICTLTTMSEKRVDVGARLKYYGKDQENLSKEVQQALEEHCDRLKEPLSSKSGSIQITSGKIEEIKISSVMKISAWKIYAKEVTVGHEQRILEVHVKKSRYRDLDNSIWKEEQLEFSFGFDDRKEGEHDENTLAEEFEELKNWVNTVFLENSSNENREPNSFI